MVWEDLEQTIFLASLLHSTAVSSYTRHHLAALPEFLLVACPRQEDFGIHIVRTRSSLHLKTNELSCKTLRALIESRFSSRNRASLMYISISGIWTVFRLSLINLILNLSMRGGSFSNMCVVNNGTKNVLWSVSPVMDFLTIQPLNLSQAYVKAKPCLGISQSSQNVWNRFPIIFILFLPKNCTNSVWRYISIYFVSLFGSYNAKIGQILNIVSIVEKVRFHLVLLNRHICEHHHSA